VGNGWDRSVTAFFNDLRYAWRLLLRQPGFTAIAVVTLGLGIGAATAIYSIVNAIVFRPSTIVHTDDLYSIGFQRRVASTRLPPARPSRDDFLPVADLRAFAAHPPDALVGVVAVATRQVVVRAPGRAERTGAEMVDGNYARVFGLAPEAGRMIEAGDDGPSARVCVISDQLWRQWFERDRSIIGQTTVTVNGEALTIVGVAPRGFRGLSAGFVTTDVWVPSAAVDPDGLRQSRPDLRDLVIGQIFVRARPGASHEAVMAAGLALFGLASNNDWHGFRVFVAPASIAFRFDRMSAIGLGILFLSGLVLLAACANLANLLYARGTKREAEIATRLSLGAGRLDVFRLFAAEAAIISALAVAAGLSLALGGLWLAGLASGSSLLPQSAYVPGRSAMLAADLAPDWTVVAYALCAGALTAVLVGGATAWRASRVAPARTLAGSAAGAITTQRGRRIREGLVALQVTVAVLLLMATGLLLVRAGDVIQTKVFLDTSQVTAARIDLSLHNYNDTRGRAFLEDLLVRLRRLPGVDGVALADGLPGYAYVSAPNLLIVAERFDPLKMRARPRISGAYAGISDDFFDTLGLHVARGRRFTANDRYGAPLVAIVTESTAARLWPGEDAIGQRFMFGSEGDWRTIVGIATDPLHRGTDSARVCESCLAFVPWDQRYRPDMLVLVKSREPRAQVEPLKAAIRAIDPEVAIQDAAPLDDSILAWVRPARAAAMLMLALGALALLIAGLGVYGVISYLVSLRTREFGIRLALGATPGRVLKSVLDHAVHLVLVGLLPGVLVAALGTQFVMIGNPMQPYANPFIAWIVVPLLLLVVGVIAGYVPARRASRVDPNVALRDF
jgi:putative ABC transport system permease protein